MASAASTTSLPALPPAASSSDQYLRKAQLFLVNPDSVLDLSNLRFTFKIRAADGAQSPGTAVVRVYNLRAKTVESALHEYSHQVVIQAGYQTGRYGVIFRGTVKQYKHGRESNTETYLDIFGSDGDAALGLATVNTTLAKGHTQMDKLTAATNAMAPYGVSVGHVDLGTGGQAFLPSQRGEPLYGTAGDKVREVAGGTGGIWSIQQGVFQFTPLTGYLPGEAVVLNAKTGLIGMPENTNQGITVRCLLNPALRVGGLLQIDNAAINTVAQTSAPGQAANTIVGFPSYNSLDYYASIEADGFYRIQVIEYEGDTRGNPWYCDLVCIGKDQGIVGNPTMSTSVGIVGNGPPQSPSLNLPYAAPGP